MIGLKLGTRAYVNYLIFLVLVACVAAVLNLIMGMVRQPPTNSLTTTTAAATAITTVINVIVSSCPSSSSLPPSLHP